MTPSHAWDSIKQFIPKHKMIWEAFYGDGSSGNYLKYLGFEVIHGQIDFFDNDLGDIIVSNPPFSKTKQIMDRLYLLDKPFILIMPSMKINTQYMRRWKDKGLQIIIPRKRIQFIKLVNGRVPLNWVERCSFDCFYYCYKMNLPKDIIWLENTAPSSHVRSPHSVAQSVIVNDTKIINDDVLNASHIIKSNCAQIIICDPPYNIGKNFGNNQDRRSTDEYLRWCDNWIHESLRILRPDGTMFIYGFSETLALILARLPTSVHTRWLVWHYTNRTSPNSKFWQRSHESILAIWKDSKIFHVDAVREPYSRSFARMAGKVRDVQPGSTTTTRFGKRDPVYRVHPKGALPRDVIKIPVLSGSAARREKVNHPTQKPLALCDKLISCCKQDQGCVFIPFGGSGSEAVAAQRHGLTTFVVEINPDYCELIERRLLED